MTLGPVEYVIVGFPDNEFSGKLAPALADLMEDKLVRILDLVFITKDQNKEVASFEFNQLDELASFAAVSGDAPGLINADDIGRAADALEPGTSAALLIWEDLWAIDFARALRGCNGVVLEGGWVPHEQAEAALAALADVG
jgi:uncharacterized membrane protein